MALDKLTGMAVFRQAVDHGSLAAAARLTGMTAEMAGHHLRTLETRLGVRLLNRTTRRLSMTDAGRAYYARCAAVLDEVALAEAEAGARQVTPRGHLRIAAPLAFGTALLAPAVAAFLDRFTEISIELDLSERIVGLLDEGYDLALRLGALSDSAFAVRQLAQFPLLVVASRSYVAANGSPDRPEMLTGAETLIYSQQSNPDRLRFVDDAGKAVEVIVSGRVRASDIGFLLALAQAGHGVLVAPEFVIRESLSDGRLLQLLPGWRTRDLSLQAILPHRSLVPAAVRSFVDFVADWF